MCYLFTVLILFSATLSAASSAKQMDLIVPRYKCADVNAETAFKLIQRLSREIDPEKKGINIQEKDPKKLAKKVSFDLTKISLKDAIRYTCMASGLHYHVSGNVVLINSKLPKKQLTTNFYTINQITPTQSFSSHTGSVLQSFE